MPFPNDLLKQSFTSTFREYFDGEFIPDENQRYWFNCYKENIFDGIPIETSWSNTQKPSVYGRYCEESDLDDKVLAAWYQFKAMIVRAYEENRVRFRERLCAVPLSEENDRLVAENTMLREHLASIREAINTQLTVAADLYSLANKTNNPVN